MGQVINSWLNIMGVFKGNYGPDPVGECSLVSQFRLVIRGPFALLAAPVAHNWRPNYKPEMPYQ